MRAAGRRRAQQQADLAEAVFYGSRADTKDLQDYCDSLRGHDRSLPPEALPGAIASASQGQPEMTWQDYLAQRKQ